MRTTFGKTFTYYIAVLMIVFFILSLGFSEVYRRYFYDDQRSELLNQALKISDIYLLSENNTEIFNNEIKILDKYMDYSFFVTDSNSKIIAISKDINTLKKGDTLKNIDFLTSSKKNYKWIKGNVNGVFNQDKYTLVYPIEKNEQIQAFIFVSVPLLELTNNINKVYFIIIFYLILAVILGFVTIHWTTTEFVRPLRRLSIISNYISKGNFDEQIEITENMNEEISQLCSSFNSIAKDLSYLEKRRREIISNISHDLRSPITSIKGFIQAMLDGVVPQEKYQYYLEIIYKETCRLQKMSDSILDLNNFNISIDSINKTDFNINELINETVLLLKGKADEKNLYLKTSYQNKCLLVNSDLEKVRRILINLIENAIKFTNNGGIFISSYIVNDKVYVEVKDTGIGLNKEEENRIFERLYKADKSRGTSGIGLGLAIVKEFVKALNQNIIVESKKGEGSKFTFTLDLTKNQYWNSILVFVI